MKHRFRVEGPTEGPGGDLVEASCGHTNPLRFSEIITNLCLH